ncbi:MAG TPA: helix-hairpin-helix domain-containing protein [Myxococcota bacterium]|nr:helix-hairpin-helix domain-containing protein [Myxococcota bacterium]
MKTVNHLTVVFVAMLSMLCLTLAGAQAKAGSSTSVVNVNTASAAQIALLPGIGIAKAKAIIAYREKKTFKTVDDLLAVKGIGKALLSKVRERVVLKGETTAKPPAKVKKTRKSKRS